MTMSSFAPPTAAVSATATDPTKHVNYSLGMVLGVDDFTQEFAYLADHEQWLTRDLLGYGTACGLQVFIETSARGPRVAVKAGNAVTPRGQLVSVPSEQCATLNDWLAANKVAVNDHLTKLTSPPASAVKLYLVLSYRECLVDNVPIPGEPCRSEDESMAASRIQDDFKLELRFVGPDQREENAVRDFVTWLSSIQIAQTGSFASLDEFLQELRRSAEPIQPTLITPERPEFPGVTQPLLRPLVSPGLLFSSPPQIPSIPIGEVNAYLRAAFRLWVTELRPNWLGVGGTAAGNQPNEEAVLLAELDIPLSRTLGGDWVVADTETIEVNEEKRPYLMSLRLIQEWLLRERAQNERDNLGGDVTGPTNDTTVEKIQNFPVLKQFRLEEGQVLTVKSGKWQADNLPAMTVTLEGDASGPANQVVVEKIQNVPVEKTALAEGQVLTVKSGKWQADNLPAVVTVTPGETVIANTAFGLTPAAGESPLYSRADHTHGTPPDPIPAHKTDPAAHTLNGDVVGTISNTLVERLQNVPVEKPAVLNDGAVLTVRGGRWQAEPLPPITGNFVEHPIGLPLYAIAAAGIVKGDGSSRPPVYNSLAARVVGDGQILINFKGYALPDKSFQYIVKALLVFNATPPLNVAVEIRPVVPTVTFQEFRADGIVLQICQNNVLVKGQVLTNLELMIEVSQFFNK